MAHNFRDVATMFFFIFIYFMSHAIFLYTKFTN